MTTDTHPQPPTGAAGPPVTVTVARRVSPGREAEYERWVDGILRAAARFDGFLGGGLLRPPQPGSEWHVVYRFRDDAALHRWEASPQRAGWLAAAEDFVDEERTAAVSGLETWFELPGRTAPAPPKWKMAVVTFAAIYPLALLINVLLVPHTQGWPVLLRPLVFAGILVPVMTWIVMPRLTRWVRRWLYPGS
ncbi:MAG TPA: antibiotic biosynthesis monooxygenase [Jiangellales bacterium]|jgi:uncharacterized protein|nr:antibiotic biosynthesis monooxygenase [Jiangellales bacterium]